MILKEKDSQAYKTNFQKAIKAVEKSGYNAIKADVEGFDQPAGLVSKSEEKTYVPDITAVQNGKKCYFEISQRTDPEQMLVTKWKLLETMASLRSGSFKVFAPRGHIKFTRDIVTRYNIEAEIIPL